MTNANDIVHFQGNYKEIEVEQKHFPNHGLTKREYFAALAMQGIISTNESIADYILVAIDAVKYADALINQLNKS